MFTQHVSCIRHSSRPSVTATAHFLRKTRDPELGANSKSNTRLFRAPGSFSRQLQPPVVTGSYTTEARTQQRTVGSRALRVCGL